MAPVSLAAGIVTDKRTAAMLAEAERLFGRPLYYAQGSYRHGMTAASGSTHDGGGAVDVRTVPLGADRKAKMRLVKILRRVGFAAWFREATPGVWGEHIHAIAIGCPDLSSGARWQVEEYRAGRDGLNGRRPDPQADVFSRRNRTWERYTASRPLVTKDVRVWGTPYDRRTRHGKRAMGDRVRVIASRHWRNPRGKRVLWLRLPDGKNGQRWIEAARTDWKG